MSKIWTIWGVYNGEREVIYEADTLTEARYLIKEYRLAFGAGWRLWIR